jgi:hypothetical protein
MKLETIEQSETALRAMLDFAAECGYSVVDMSEEGTLLRPGTGYLEIGSNQKGQVVIDYRHLPMDETGVGHIGFSPTEARNLASMLMHQAREVELAPVVGLCAAAGAFEGTAYLTVAHSLNSSRSASRFCLRTSSPWQSSPRP